MSVFTAVFFSTMVHLVTIYVLSLSPAIEPIIPFLIVLQMLLEYTTVSPKNEKEHKTHKTKRLTFLFPFLCETIYTI